MRIYLAGPVDPAILETCLLWRRETSQALAAHGMTGVDPCRGGQHPAPREDGRITQLPVSARQLVIRDKGDIRSCQAVLVYWPPESDKRGIGTIMEIALASDWSIPVLLVDPGAQISTHPWVQALVTEHHPSIDAAVNALSGYWRHG